MKQRAGRPVVWVAQSWWVDEIYAGVATVGLECGWSVNASMRHLRGELVVPARVDGVILFRGESAALGETVARLGVPVVNLDPYDNASDGPKIVWNDRDIGREAAYHLAACDPVRLVFVDWGYTSPIPEARRLGFIDGCRRSGFEPEVVSYKVFDPVALAAGGRFGVFASNDECAIRVMEACLEAGLRIPEDCVVVGADDDPIACEILPVPLSSVNPGHRRRGVEAARLLERMMRGETVSRDPVTVPIAGVTARASTRCTDTGEPDLDRLIRHFRENARRPVGVETLCEECGVPMRRALYLLSTKAGTSPLRLLRECRLRLAERFEAVGDLKVETIARNAGFGSALTWRRAKEAAHALSTKPERRARK